MGRRVCPFCISLPAAAAAVARLYALGRGVKRRRFWVLIIFTPLFAACSAWVLPGENSWVDGGGSPADSDRPLWNILIYMCADNDLESAAIADFNEVEAAPLSDWINVLILLDRSPGGDATNGDWSDTRLFQAKEDPAGENIDIVSEELSCPELGLGPGIARELNMGDAATLRGFREFASRRYPADRTAVILWGHGTGYRSPSRIYPEGIAGWKGVTVDFTSTEDPLSTSEIRTALEAAPATSRPDVLALDSCYGALLELAYEVRATCNVMIASEERVPASGWDYFNVLTRFSAGDGTLASFYTAAVSAFEESYALFTGATISVLDLGSTQTVFSALEQAVTALLDATALRASRDRLRELLFTEAEDFYATPGDLNLDLWDVGRIAARFAPQCAASGSALQSAVENLVITSWHHASGNPGAHGVAIHFVELDDTGYACGHSEEYFHDAVVPHPLAFVADSSWVPDLTHEQGLLYRLWYEQMP